MHRNYNELVKINKPAQYLGGELNSVVKNSEDISARIALAFPDTYEVGMSHVGIQILYDLINRDNRAWAERAYMPFPDMAKHLRDSKRSLYSLESKTVLSNFDAIGFSLQYELCGTNILEMLALSNIPAYASDRTDSHPIVIGGGPYTYHPEALAPFFDVFFVGDAEEFIPEFINTLSTATRNNEGRVKKREILEILSSLEGIYLPSAFVPTYDCNYNLLSIDSKNADKSTIVRRLLPTLENAPFPRKPVVPNINIVHNRLSVEVMRGCVRGCRFCQAGYLYRPQRERSPEEVLNLVEEVLPNTGFEEVSLLSLSTADYCSIVPLLESMMDRYGEGETLAVSFPSTRVDALTPEILEQVQRVRRTNFTIAPEGGSQRLRDVINKGVSDEQIFETCSNVFNMGWSGIKLYFMMGLPTETDEDIESIIDLAKRIKAMPNARDKDITVSVSTHVPKPHTPFQWAAQITPEETKRIHSILANGLKKAGINFRYHDPFSSFLEGIFCRGGRELAPVIQRAHQLGATLDAWQDHLKPDIWMSAFRDFGIDPYTYLRERNIDEVLPWDHLSCGIPKSYFAKEYRRSLKAKTTPDCLKFTCSICEACDYDVKKNVLWPRGEAERKLNISYTTHPDNLRGEENKEHHICSVPITTLAIASPIERLRLRYNKSNIYRMLGHLELSTIFHRACRRAGLPIAYSKGFSPHPKISFSPPIPLGIESTAEYLDVSFYEEVDVATVLDLLNEALPNGLDLVSGVKYPINGDSLQQSIKSSRYIATFLRPLKELSEKESILSIEEFLNFKVSRKARPGKAKGKKRKPERNFVLSNFLFNVKISESTLEFSLSMEQGVAAPTPLEVILSIPGVTEKDVLLVKTEVYFNKSSIELEFKPKSELPKLTSKVANSSLLSENRST